MGPKFEKADKRGSKRPRDVEGDGHAELGRRSVLPASAATRSSTASSSSFNVNVVDLC